MGRRHDGRENLHCVSSDPCGRVALAEASRQVRPLPGALPASPPGRGSAPSRTASLARSMASCSTGRSTTRALALVTSTSKAWDAGNLAQLIEQLGDRVGAARAQVDDLDFPCQGPRASWRAWRVPEPRRRRRDSPAVTRGSRSRRCGDPPSVGRGSPGGRGDWSPRDPPRWRAWRSAAEMPRRSGEVLHPPLGLELGEPVDVVGARPASAPRRGARSRVGRRRHCWPARTGSTAGTESKRLTVVATLVWTARPGCASHSGMKCTAARCTTASGRKSAQHGGQPFGIEKIERDELESVSSSASKRCAPECSESATSTSWPAATRNRVSSRPTNPFPPLTRTRRVG